MAQRRRDRGVSVQGQGRKVAKSFLQLTYNGDYDSYVDRQNSVRRAIVSPEDDSAAEDVECVAEEPGDCDSEMSWSDEDVNVEDERSVECHSMELDGNRIGHSCFADETDAIRVVRVDGKMRCVVEEDLGRLYFYASKGWPSDKLKVSFRTFVYRVIARWLNELQMNVGGILESPSALLDYFTKSTINQKGFVAEHEVDFAKYKDNEDEKVDISKVVKNAVLIWRDYSVPLSALFN